MAENQETAPPGERVVIKKYANRRLYNTASSSYVTLEHLAEMTKKGVDFVVYDAKTNDDITRSVLTQIIFEEESQGQSLLPIQFLRQLIGFYGNSMQAFLPSYLELSLSSFTQQQERMRAQFASLAPSLPGLPGAGSGAFDAQIAQTTDRAERVDGDDHLAGKVRAQLLERDPAPRRRGRRHELHAPATRFDRQAPGQRDDRPDARDLREERPVLVLEVAAERADIDRLTGQPLQDRGNRCNHIDEFLPRFRGSELLNDREADADQEEPQDDRRGDHGAP